MNNLETEFASFLCQLGSNEAVEFFEGLKDSGKVSLSDDNNLTFSKLSVDESLLSAKYMTESNISAAE